MDVGAAAGKLREIAGRAIAWTKAAFKRVPRPILFFGGGVLALLCLAGVVVVLYFGRIVTRTMDGRRWSLPTRLYSDVWVVRPGDALSADDALRRLTRLRYAEVSAPPVSPGRLFASRGRLVVGVNDRETAYGRTPGFPVRIDFSGRRVASVRREEDGAALPYVVFEPEVVGSVFDQKMEDRTLVRLDQVPKVVIDAILTIEDRDFFSHSGISFKRLLGAAIRDVTKKTGPIQGGSTLTQQLVKNMFLTPERTFKRKVVEALMAVIVEARYSKSQILEAYLNEIYLGQRGAVSVTGVEEASRFYFGKSVSQLDLPEAALLAGIISSPGRYSPFRSAERARDRRALVLRGMLELRKIDRRQYESALAAPLTRVGKPPTGIVAPHFVDFVMAQVKDAPGPKEGGLSLYTTLDPDMQQAAQGAVQRGLEELEKRYRRLRPKGDEDPLQAAIIALDPATGSVRALVGGRDYQISQFNRVVQAKRQPGSLFKPFVYLAAFERRDLPSPITPATLLSDSPIAVVWGDGEDETWSPKNYDNDFRGMMTVRQALEQSINIPTVRVAVTEVSPGRTLLPDVIETARRAGITSQMKPYPSLALGAFEISPMEIAAAFCTFANGGFRVQPNALLGIVGPNGRRIEAKDAPLSRGADADAVSVLDSILRGVVDRGTGGSARRLGAQGIFAGKTGTTNDGRDAWFIGFSPRLLVAVWVGTDDNRSLNLSGAMAAVPIYAEFVRRLPSHYFEAPFPTSPGVVGVSIDPTTGMLVTEDCPASFNEVFLAGTEPKERCTVHSGAGPGVFSTAPAVSGGNAF